MDPFQAIEPPSDDVFDTYLAGQADPEQTSAIQAYLSGASAEIVPPLKRVSAVYSEQEAASADIPALWNRVVARIASHDGVPDRSMSRARRQTWAPWNLMLSGILASGLAVLLVVTGIRYWPSTPSSESQLAMTYTTRNGERATIALPDGSLVELNVASRVEIPADYTKGNRTVRLVGEATFSVVSQSDAPFTVISGPSTARVLGTKFLVRYYPSDTAATIAVQSGKVAVGTTVLSSAQQLSVSAHGVTPVRAIDPYTFAFESGKMVLNRMALRDAVVELNRWYDADIRIADSTLGLEPIEGTFVKGSLSDLAEQFEWAMGFRVVRHGRALTLSRR